MQGEDLVHPLKVSLEDLYNGKTCRLAINRNKVCPTCEGRGGKVRQLSQCSGHVCLCRVICAQSRLGYLSITAASHTRYACKWCVALCVTCLTLVYIAHLVCVHTRLVLRSSALPAVGQERRSSTGRLAQAWCRSCSPHALTARERYFTALHWTRLAL